MVYRSTIRVGALLSIALVALLVFSVVRAIIQIGPHIPLGIFLGLVLPAEGFVLILAAALLWLFIRKAQSKAPFDRLSRIPSNARDR
jgi:hypothetical protein